MAAEGRRFTKGSDDFYDFPCLPCSKEGKNVASVKHCVDCDENLCTSCLNDHNKFSGMKGHQILDKVQRSVGRNLQLPSQRCTKHGGRLIDVYCPNHDSVCCSTCIAVEHSSCHGIKFIPDVAKGISKSNEFQQFEADMKTLQSRYVAFTQSEGVELQALQQEQESICKEIRTLRNKINKHFDKMEEELLNEVNTKFKQYKQKVQIDRKETDEVLAEIQGRIHQLHESRHGNESELFALLKTGRKKMKECCNIADRLERSRKPLKLELQTDRTILETLNENYAMAHLVESFGSVSVSLLDTYGIKVDDDKSDCDICGFCMTNDGCIFLADYENKRLKKLDSTYNVLSCLNLPDSPFGLCRIDDMQFAVTLISQKKVQLVHNTEPMKLQKSFMVGDRCRSIAHNNGLLYVCCGGSNMRKEGPGHLEIYNIDGGLLRSFFDSLSVPVYLDISNNGREIYVSDPGNVFIVFDKNGKVLIRYEHGDKNRMNGICRITDNKLCCAVLASNEIIVIANDGRQQQQILTGKDGVIKPKTLCYDSKHSRLIVFMCEFRNEIKVFQLEC
ncbi:uncharacterized protein LOC123533087 isoform X3 [Mercenaria mercenaria]|uniref:uncharacterized protein LOC123533087 isoform X3 n=1 Tax=Mercenaria mercenaria TaxID=6596 RepID=UPI00234E8002|nr:uncharacterized protein LOC123533087 isoform X3 [Mercenaria mercenaria]